MKVNWAEGAVGGLKKQSPGFLLHLVIPYFVRKEAQKVPASGDCEVLLWKRH